MVVQMKHRPIIAGCCVAAAISVACHKNSPEPPSMTPGAVETVNGTERLGWTQRAADSAELATFGYAVYVDGARSDLTGVSCSAASPSSPSFDCSAPLPSMTAGPHTLELATFIVDGGGLLESARSAPLQVNKSMPVVSVTSPSPRSAPEWNAVAFVTRDGQRLQVRRVAGGFVNAIDVAFLRDGRMLVAEEGGQVRIVMSNGEVLRDPALSLVRGASAIVRLRSLDVGSDGFVYLGYVGPSRGGGLAFTVARFAEASNRLVGETTILDEVPAASLSDATVVRVGGDGRLFVALDEGGNPELAGDYGSRNGKILRLDGDGTTPADQAGLVPVFLSGVHSPRGFDWQPASELLWVADRLSPRAATLSAIGMGTDAVRKRGERIASYTLPADTRPSSVLWYRGALIPALRNDLLIASDEGAHVLRVKIDQSGGTRIVQTEQLLHNSVGGIRALAAGPAGNLYLATADTVGVVVPE
jgi:glucose/arabinose dehydrogenase